MQYKIIFLLFAGHLMTDLSQGIAPALLPYFISEYNLTYSATGFLMLSLTISSSIVQPAFGFLADKKPLPWLIALGPILAGTGIAVASLFHHYYIIMGGFFLCGLGVAAFHPEGARMASKVAGKKKASSMSFFAVGGNAGFALGPIIAAGLIFFFGLRGIALYFIPALLMAIILLITARRLSHLSSQKNPDETNNTEAIRDHQRIINQSSADKLKDHWKPFVLLTLTIICRSIITQGFNTFLPSYWIVTFNASREIASLILAIFLGAGIIGNIVGGILADRFGNQRIVFWGYVLLIPQLLILPNILDSIFAVLLLTTAGFTIFTTFSPMIVMGQQLLPNQVGFASGITIGLAVSIGGFATPILGKLADLSGIQAVFHLLGFLPILATGLIYIVPKMLKKSAINTEPI